MEKIIFDYYIKNATLDHVIIRPNKKKIMKIPFYITLKSNKYGIYNNEEKDSNEFFSMMSPTFIIDGGIDYFTGHNNFIPYFSFVDFYKPKTKIFNVGILSTLSFISMMFKSNALSKFIGFDINEYDYINSDSYYDYLFSGDGDIKNYALITIRKYCNLSYILNFLISSNLTSNMDYMYYLNKYIILFRIISNNKIQNFFMNSIISNSYTIFNSEENIFKMTALKYAPRYLDIKYPNNFQDIYKIITPNLIEEKINNLLKQNYQI